MGKESTGGNLGIETNEEGLHGKVNVSNILGGNAAQLLEHLSVEEFSMLKKTKGGKNKNGPGAGSSDAGANGVDKTDLGRKNGKGRMAQEYVKESGKQGNNGHRIEVDNGPKANLNVLTKETKSAETGLDPKKNVVFCFDENADPNLGGISTGGRKSSSRRGKDIYGGIRLSASNKVQIDSRHLRKFDHSGVEGDGQGEFLEAEPEDVIGVGSEDDEESDSTENQSMEGLEVDGENSYVHLD